MLRLFAITTILLTCADHWTTYLCLQEPIQGWHVAEANPVAEWLFGWAGLNAGLFIDSFITLGAVFFLYTLFLISPRFVSTGYAVVNNLGAISRMGIAPWSGVA